MTRGAAAPARASDRNASFWDANAETWPLRDAETSLPTWGIWNVPESAVGALGDVVGKDIVDLGCSFGEASVALALQGASSVTGYDLSQKRIKVARRLAHDRGATECRFQVLDAAGPLPLADASIDIAFSHRGALSYGNPRDVIPELARVLRPGGVLAACTVSPIAVAGYWLPEGCDYLTTERFDDGRTIEYALPVGEWVRLLRRHGFELEDVVELPCPRLPHPVEQVLRARRRLVEPECVASEADVV